MNTLQVFENPEFGSIRTVEIDGEKGFDENVTNRVHVFDCNEIPRIREIETSLKNTFRGVFYAIEWDDMLKIGHSQKPYTRLMALKRTAEKYGRVCLGRICISEPHTNHGENEQKLHAYFSERRIPETELFGISLDEFIRSICNAGIVYEDKPEEFELKGAAFIATVENFISGKASTQKADSSTTTSEEYVLVPKKVLTDLTVAVQRLAEQLDAQALFENLLLPFELQSDSDGEKQEMSESNLAPENRGW